MNGRLNKDAFPSELLDGNRLIFVSQTIDSKQTRILTRNAFVEDAERKLNVCVRHLSAHLSNESDLFVIIYHSEF